MKTEDLGAVVTHHKALKFLLMDGEVAGFDVEVAAPREAQHVLALRVPGHAVGVGLLTPRELVVTTHTIAASS